MLNLQVNGTQNYSLAILNFKICPRYTSNFYRTDSKTSLKTVCPMVCSHNILITINWLLKARQKQRYGPKFKNKECEPTGREKKSVSDHASK